MFGYVTICEPELKVKDLKKYKAYYCGLCRTLKERHGNLGQITLTYDMTFAVILLTSLYESPTQLHEYRCKVHPVRKQKMLQNEISEYAADMNVILAYFHMKDDWSDEKKLSGFLGIHAFKRKIRKLIRKYPRQCRVIKEQLQKLSQAEKQNVLDIDYTAGCFGKIMAELFVYKQDIWEERLRKMGFYLGKFIYIMDAYDDLDKDMKKGCYNPMRQFCEREDYEQYSHDLLCMMMAEAAAQFEGLPCLLDVDILRNILYDGVWIRYHKIQEEKNKSEEEKNVKKSI